MLTGSQLTIILVCLFVNGQDFLLGSMSDTRLLAGRPDGDSMKPLNSDFDYQQIIETLNMQLHQSEIERKQAIIKVEELEAILKDASRRENLSLIERNKLIKQVQDLGKENAALTKQLENSKQRREGSDVIMATDPVPMEGLQQELDSSQFERLRGIAAKNHDMVMTLKIVVQTQRKLINQLRSELDTWLDKGFSKSYTAPRRGSKDPNGPLSHIPSTSTLDSILQPALTQSQLNDFVNCTGSHPEIMDATECLTFSTGGSRERSPVQNEESTTICEDDFEAYDTARVTHRRNQTVKNFRPTSSSPAFGRAPIPEPKPRLGSRVSAGYNLSASPKYDGSSPPRPPVLSDTRRQTPSRPQINSDRPTTTPRVEVTGGWRPHAATSRFCPTCNAEYPSDIPECDFEKHVLECADRLTAAQGSAMNDDERSCPVCNAHFPMAISQIEYEQHVINHFEAEEMGFVDVAPQ